ncbi:MAG: hypothetical protein IJ991_14855, partial [Thermoguttaceae bacterium]|nr:hypothetical protein [Thermoguttaceae bacterium]
SLASPAASSASSLASPAASSASSLASPAASSASSLASPAASSASSLASPAVANVPSTGVSTSSTDLLPPLPQTSYVSTPVGRYGSSRRLNASTFATRTPTSSVSSPVASAPASSVSSPVASAPASSVSSPIASAPASSVSSPVASAPAASVGYRLYVAKEGDNLLNIAHNELGSSSRWGEIARLNNFPTGAAYFDAGTTIKLPLDD